jgi:translation initiation factor eIF-2B subunit delta
VLKWIDDSKNLHHLQVLYDVTPAHYINMVITEYGSLPPSSVPVVHRLSTNV